VTPPNPRNGTQHNADPLNNAYASISQWFVRKTAELAGMLDAIPEDRDGAPNAVIDEILA
jgi:hypothetical protein